MEYMFIILVMVLVVAAFLSRKLKTISRDTTHEKQLKYIEEAVFSKKYVMNISEGHLKRISCEKAGIKYFEIPAKYTGNELKPVIDFFESMK